MTAFYLGEPHERNTTLWDDCYFTAHSEDCALNCEHCHHGSDCYKTCCWCGGVRDGEGTVSLEFVECDCEVKND